MSTVEIRGSCSQSWALLPGMPRPGNCTSPQVPWHQLLSVTWALEGGVQLYATGQNGGTPDHWKNEQRRSTNVFQRRFLDDVEKVEPSSAIGTTLWETVWRVLKKFNIQLSYDPGFSLLCMYPKKLKTDSKRDLHTRVQRSIIHTSQKVDTPHVSSEG